MTSKLLIVLTMFLTSCNLPEVPPTPSNPPVSTLGIAEIVAKSSCAAVSWKDRGKAPNGYVQGVALTYAKDVCKLPNVVLTSELGSSEKDVLALYSSNFKSANISLDSADNRLLALYTVLIGLGMRESSGKYCEGRDMSATNTSADTAEAGLFQASYNSHSASSALSNLYSSYKANISGCMLDTFKQGVNASATSCAAKTVGGGTGEDWQKLTRSCPSFATEYAATLTRVLRKHFGPLNRKEAEVKTECHQMLKDVKAFVNANQGVCQLF